MRNIYYIYVHIVVIISFAMWRVKCAPQRTSSGRLMAEAAIFLRKWNWLRAKSSMRYYIEGDMCVVSHIYIVIAKHTIFFFNVQLNAEFALLLLLLHPDAVVFYYMCLTRIYKIYTTYIKNWKKYYLTHMNIFSFSSNLKCPQREYT